MTARNRRADKAEASPKAVSPGAEGRRATSYDVAKLAGVSQSAVSRCFAANASMSPQTRARVLKAAAELGYRPNALAQGLISRRTNLVAVIISSLTNLYYPEVLSNLVQKLTAQDMRVLLFALDAESDADETVEQVLRHRVDGVICAARLSDAQITLFAQHQVPLVLYNRTSNSPFAASVSCDSTAGERDLVSRLLSAGHRRFGLIAGPADSSVGEERRTAVVERLREAGLPPPPEVRGDFSYDSGALGAQRLMTGGASFDALVCVSDLMAIGAIDACRSQFQLRVPEDISVVGFDGSGPAGWASYLVTSVRQPVRRMTEAAIALLSERIEDRRAQGEHRTFIGAFVAGASARLV